MISINHCQTCLSADRYMPRGYPSLTKEQKQEIINRIKEKGEKVSDLAKEYGVVPKTIYNPVCRQAGCCNERRKAPALYWSWPS